ncbi:hypothetical protein LPJ78_003488 [Coemansia sp. RSA 989]|nr:hypothetical protein LPJ68_001335 [Coemansia sp. RSA 1086]KAJ1751171.1 hypothetical protein LPJ79_002283 [Coemansia sp. RSA 1821]KAJ1864259.1 hypothetical protein LPJ78_003488 [Coemansia sp. RSA 989]KAJ1871820.1 hypothetical protein LPJ55_003580 [Coemansia sp. RSA 990]KAJ2631865.1 hypothetical protein H4R22_001668 [Coemansia sp. RSA 1290]KAJ2653359.1 hypothetical protein IWW40_000412 [Coemansia sp. RSA 1250]KAJ2676288.1 hypothetical protein IWW42_000576 [Coemansia sp. RSA 1085]
MKVLILSGDYVEDYELYAPLKSLEMLGIEAHVVCPDKKAGDKIQTALHIVDGWQTYSEKPGHPFDLTHTFADIKLDEYAGLVVPGGRFPEYQRYDQRVLDVVKHFFDKNLPVAAICHGLQILSAAGVLQGRSCSAFPMCKLDVIAGGGKYVDFEAFSMNAHVDGNLVSAPAYPAIGVWMREFIKLLGVKVQL